MVELTTAAFGEGRLAEEVQWKSVVLIPKGKGDYRDTILVEVVWKAVGEILNHRITASVTYHNFFPRFQAGYGKGTATLDAKLIHQLAAMR